ncbi:MAG: hypothetical protein ABL900_18385 [Burkholderiaceae bacterium]
MNFARRADGHRRAGRCTRAARVRLATAAALSVAALLAAGATYAQAPARGDASDATLRVAALGCKQGIQLTSKGATLSQVLARMAQTLHFEHEYWSQDDPVLDLDMRSQPIDVMALLSSQANLIVRYAPDRRCAKRWRIASVWVLPAGEVLVGNRRRVERAAAPLPPTPAYGSSAITDTGSDGVSDYLRAHGLTPALPAASAASAADGG